VHQGCVAGANEGGEGSGGVVADIAKLSVGREAYYTRELATDHEQYLSGHGESRLRRPALPAGPDQARHGRPDRHSRDPSSDPGGPPLGDRAHPRLGNQYGKLRWCTERRRLVVAFWLALASAAIVCGRLVRRAWTHYRWEGRPRRRP
jgi:hypothetical protein